MGLGIKYMNLATDGQIATVTKFLATDGQIATVVQTLLKADLGARKNGGNGAFLATDGLTATVVKMGLGASLLKADLGARKNGGIGAAVGQMGNARGRYEAIGREYTVAMVLPDASDPHYITCICLFA